MTGQIFLCIFFCFPCIGPISSVNMFPCHISVTWSKSRTLNQYNPITEINLHIFAEAAYWFHIILSLWYYLKSLVNPLLYWIYFRKYKYISIFYRFAKLRWHLLPWWRHQMETFSALLSLSVGNSPVTGEFPAQDQWRRALMVSLICARINGWVNNREAGDLRCHCTHYDISYVHGRQEPISLT